MQNIKGAIRIFAILMAASCFFYLSFSFVTRSWEKKAHQYAVNYSLKKSIADGAKARSAGNPLEERRILDSVIEFRERFYLKDSIAGKKYSLSYILMRVAKTKS